MNSSLSILFALSSLLSAEFPFSHADELFTLKIKPLLTQKCLACHGDDPQDLGGEPSLLTRDDFLKGGESVTDLLVPGRASKSFLMTVVKWEDPDYEMPPKENDRLTPEEITDLVTWINAGAPWPDKSIQDAIKFAERKKKVTRDGILVETSGGLSDDWTYRRYQPDDLWAFLPLEPIANPDPAKHPVDAFIDLNLHQKGFKRAPRADLPKLLRRLNYTLTGLPPQPEQMTAWLKRLREGDYETEYRLIVDELLASPHYGERWGQHWLDVIRYADTAGFSNDFEMSNFWRFRDYVIRSFNDDKPYHQFVREQIAGDELNPDNPEMTIATGFLRSGPWEHTGMLAGKVSRQQYLDDLTDNIGQAFLATPLSCCKCHDHKFDPIPTRDYYRIYAALATTQPAEMKAPFLPSENRNSFAKDREHVERLLTFATTERDALYEKRESMARQWYEERGKTYKDYGARNNDPDGTKPPRHYGLTPTEEGQIKVREQDVKIWNRRLARFEPRAQSVYNGGYFTSPSIKLRPPSNEKQCKADKVLPENFILKNGSLDSPGEPVSPGVLSMLGLPTDTPSTDDPYALPTGFSNRRLGLANWIANPDNGLAIRTIVNRVWGYHFGTAIAGNPNNLGATGKKPTHPELLDYLANQFVQDGWSFKKLHKLILTSETWQQTTTHPEKQKLEQADPNNALLAYFQPRRLSAEEYRDTLLTFTGELNPEMGGLPARPEINREVALNPRMIQFSLAPAYQPNASPEERHRRSIYSYRIRGLADPFMEVFNKPGADKSCEGRDAPTVTPQVFTQLYSENMTNRSLAFALKLKQSTPSPSQQITTAFNLVLTREPTADEHTLLLAHYEDMLAYHKHSHSQPTTYPKEITRSLVEEFTGEPFEYQ
ncbi:MAG: PSD1 and planctomycete cytochrome C domain-containing protein [Verrucomicrobiota bacterium]